MDEIRNVLGTPLKVCSLSPLTGFMRDGICRAVSQDFGVHGVCSEVTEEFLNFTRTRGNDLSTPNVFKMFRGLKPGDRWCLCASRWKEAMENNVAPPVVLSATGEEVLKYINLIELKKYACKETI